jgi:hypothetical protein
MFYNFKKNDILHSNHGNTSRIFETRSVVVMRLVQDIEGIRSIDWQRLSL